MNVEGIQQTSNLNGPVYFDASFEVFVFEFLPGFFNPALFIFGMKVSKLFLTGEPKMAKVEILTDGCVIKLVNNKRRINSVQI